MRVNGFYDMAQSYMHHAAPSHSFGDAASHSYEQQAAHASYDQFVPSSAYQASRPSESFGYPSQPSSYGYGGGQSSGYATAQNATYANYFGEGGGYDSSYGSGYAHQNSSYAQPADYGNDMRAHWQANPHMYDGPQYTKYGSQYTPEDHLSAHSLYAEGGPNLLKPAYKGDHDAQLGMQGIAYVNNKLAKENKMSTMDFFFKTNQVNSFHDSNAGIYVDSPQQLEKEYGVPYDFALEQAHQGASHDPTGGLDPKHYVADWALKKPAIMNSPKNKWLKDAVNKHEYKHYGNQVFLRNEG